jgi:hypothetical protein
MKSLKPLCNRLFVLSIWILITACQSKTYKVTDNSYSGLLTVFHDFDRLRQPKVVDGIPDYSATAMEAQLDSVKILQAKLSRMDTANWRKDQQIDYRLMEAHLHGLEFNHTIMHRWSSDPAYYSTIGWFNPTMEGALYLPHLPIPEKQLQIFRSRIEALPGILAAAKKNLTQMTPDLAQLGIKRKLWEEERFKEWLPQLAVTYSDLKVPVNAAINAIIDFRKWLEEKKPALSGTSGIGIENYNWLLKNVYLSPYSWEQCITITQRELERSLALLKLEEFKNRNLPPLPIIDHQAQFDSLHLAGQEWLIQFIRNNDILPQPDFLVTKGSGGWSRPNGRNFFENILDRDPLPLLPHDMVGHSPDAQREEMWNTPPFPRAYDPFYVSGTRAEALATGMEEILMNMGMLDQRPRSRELTYMLRIFRAIRALADLRMHSNEFTLEQAMTYAMKTVPYGWYNQNTYLIWEEMDLYLRQPGYGVGYLMGSVQLEQLISRQSMKLADKFEFKKFMEDFLKPGLIPISMIEWTME